MRMYCKSWMIFRASFLLYQAFTGKRWLLMHLWAGAGIWQARLLTAGQYRNLIGQISNYGPVQEPDRPDFFSATKKPPSAVSLPFLIMETTRFELAVSTLRT